MVDFTFQELNSDTGTDTASTLRNVANAAANAVCNLYENYPTGILPSVGSTPISNFSQGFFDELCRPRGNTPPTPTPNFTGGQCVCVQYVVSFVFNPPVGAPIPGSQTVDGPVGQIVKTPVSEPTVPPTSNWEIYGGTDACGGRRKFGLIAGGNSDGTLTIAGVARLDGLPDTCGDPPPQYNPDTGTPPDYEFNTDITIGGNTVNVPVTVVPTIFAPLTVFRPQFTVDVGGIDVNFNLGGVNLSIKPTLDVDFFLPGNDPRVLPPTPTPPKTETYVICDNTDVLVRLDDIDEQLDEIEECACPPEYTTQTVVYDASNSRSIGIPPLTRYVNLELSTVGVNVRVQSGNAGAPAVLFAGWYSFGVGDNRGDRKPISHESNCFVPPKEATSFSYTVVFNSLATLEVVYYEET